MQHSHGCCRVKCWMILLAANQPSHHLQIPCMYQQVTVGMSYQCTVVPCNTCYYL